MSTSGYSISIRALDEASAQIKRINSALKELQQTDTANDNQTEQSSRKRKRGYDDLLGGVQNFGKQSTKALSEIGKLFDITSSKIGNTVESLASSFKLGGLAVGAALGAKAIDAVTGALVKAGNAAVDLRDAAANIFGKMDARALEKLQKFQDLLGRYGISAPESTGVLDRISEQQLAAKQSKITNLSKVAALPGMNIDVLKDAPDVIAKKLIDAQVSGKFKSLGGDEAKAAQQLMTDVLGNAALTKIINRPDAEEFWNKAKTASEQFTVQTVEATNALARIADKSNEVWQEFIDLGNSLTNQFAKGISDSVIALGDMAKSALQWAKLNPGKALEGLAGGGLLALLLGKKGAEGILGWAGRSMGIKPTGVNPADVAKGVGFLGFLGKVFSIAGMADLLSGVMENPGGPGAKSWGNMTPAERDEWLKSQGRTPDSGGGGFGSFWGWLTGGGKGSAAPAPNKWAQFFGPGRGSGAGAMSQKAYDSISKAEGTYGKNGIDYNMLQGGGHADLVNMTLAQVMAMQKGETPAAGGFQIQKSTMSDAAKALKLDPDKDKFTPENQRRMADWIRQKQGWGAWSGFKAHPELRKEAEQAGAIGYSNQGAIRNKPITEFLENKLKEVAETVLGKGAKAVVFSGGQDAEGPHRTGSHRHDVNAQGRGQAADVRFFLPGGQQATGDDLGRIGQYWAAKKYGGVGLTMPGGGVHLDQHTDKAPTWSYGGGETQEQKDAVQRGIRGELPKLAPVAPIMPEKPKPQSEVGPQTNDSMHRVEFTIANAPPGSRSRITESSGNSDLSLRTRYALGVV